MLKQGGRWQSGDLVIIKYYNAFEVPSDPRINPKFVVELNDLRSRPLLQLTTNFLLC